MADEDEFYDDDDDGDEGEAIEPRYPWHTVIIACFLVLILLCSISMPAIGLVYWWWKAPRGPSLTGDFTATTFPKSPTLDRQPLAEAPPVSPGSPVNRIALINTDGQLQTIAPDGAGSHTLTDAARIFQFPAWSPDGRWLAVIGANNQNAAVYTLLDQDIAGNNSLQEIYQSDAAKPFYLYWSPDSRQVSFLALHPQGIALYLAQVGQALSARLITTGQPLYWDWNPAGDQLLVHAGGHDGRLAVIDADGRDEDAGLGHPGFFQAPGISASGRYRAYAEVDGGGSRSLVVENNKGGQRLAVPHLGQVAMTWSPQADKLAYTSPLVSAPAFFGPLRLLDMTTGDSRVLSNELVLAFFWSPDGQRIAFLTLNQLPWQNEVEAAAAPFVQPVANRSLSAYQIEPDAVLLDLWVVEVTGAGADATHLTTFRPTRLFLLNFLPFFDQYALSHQIWSPQSDALVISAMENDQARIQVVPVDGRFIIPVASGVIAFWSRQ
jgi:TolB protein